MDNTDLEMALLGFLVEGQKYGYELFKEISDPMGIGSVWRVKIGKMYSMLKRLESQGFISATSKKDGNRPQKNMFSLTKKGKDMFKKWMIEPIKHGRDLRILFLLKIYFIKTNDQFYGKDLILKQIKECENWKSNNKIAPNEMNDESSFIGFVRKYRSSQIDGFINWLDWCGEAIHEEIL